MLRTLPRLLRTAIHLKPVQIGNRIRRLLSRPSVTAMSGAVMRPPRSDWRAGVERPPTMLGPTTIEHLSRKGEIADAADWNGDGVPKLWLYHLHYFEDLGADNAVDRVEWHRALISRWIAENPIMRGNGWEPYPISRRIVNWASWLLRGEAPPAGMLDSLYTQARALSRTLEWHLLGNHIFVNAKALIFAGSLFTGEEPDAWLKLGLAILQREILEQVLPDGGHFELSPMYHSLILEDLLDLLQLTNLYPDQLATAALGQEWRGVARRMLDWLAVMTLPNGDYGAFNDSVAGMAGTLDELRRYATRIGLDGGADQNPGARHLEASGYIRLVRGPWTLLFDAARVGPDYIPGHAHADTLSIEVSHEAECIAGNSGISTYDVSAKRDWERSTAAHATVEIDGRNSSETWASFRVGRRARPRDIGIEHGENFVTASAAHDGYRFLPGSPVHRRTVLLDDRSVTIIDRIEGAGRHTAVSRLPLPPGAVAVRNGEAMDVSTLSGKAFHISCKSGRVEIEGGIVAVKFGLAVPRAVIACSASGDLPLVLETKITPSNAHPSSDR